MNTLRGATADNATTRNITHADVVRPKQTNSKNASEKKRKRLENRNLSINEDLVEIIEIPARGKKRSISERSTYRNDKERGAAERLSEDLRQELEMSPVNKKSSLGKHSSSGSTAARDRKTETSAPGGLGSKTEWSAAKKIKCYVDVLMKEDGRVGCTHKCPD